jgi:hypothetical protein
MVRVLPHSGSIEKVRMLLDSVSRHAFGRDPFGSQEEDSRETERMIGPRDAYLDSLLAIVTLLVAEGGG